MYVLKYTQPARRAGAPAGGGLAICTVLELSEDTSHRRFHEPKTSSIHIAM